MELVKAIKTVNRMCGYYCKDYVCTGCPLDKPNNGMNMYCNKFMYAYPEKAEEIIMKWAEEHPIKTNRQVLEEVLKEKFGDIFDVAQFGCSQFKDRHCDKECDKCEYYDFWTREYKEVEKCK